MKKYLFFLCLCLCMGALCAAEDTYESVLQKAEKTSNIREKAELFQKAASLTTDEKKKRTVLLQAFPMAESIKEKDMMIAIATGLSENKELSPADRAKYRFRVIELLWTWDQWPDFTGPDPQIMEDFLNMPGVSPELEIKALMKLPQAYMRMNRVDLAIKVYERAIQHPKIDLNTKSDAMIALANAYRDVYQQQKALECLRTMTQLPNLTPARKVKAFMMLGDMILSGSGYYFEPKEEHYKAAYEAFAQAAKVKGVSVTLANDAICKTPESYLKRNQYQKAVELYQAILDNKKNPPNRFLWVRCTEQLGHAKMGMKDYEGAVAEFEKLPKFFSRSGLGDIYRYLGRAYYCNKDYMLAIGAYETARKILEDQERVEDDRPAWCKGWIGRIKWFTTGKNAAELDAAMQKRYKKLMAMAEADPNAPRPKMSKKISEFKSANAGATNPESKGASKKKEIKSMEDIEGGPADLLEEMLME